MKKLSILTFAVLGIFAMVCCPNLEGKTVTNGVVFKIQKNETPHLSDPEIKTGEGKIVWSGTKVIGGGHEGTVEIKESDLQFMDGKLTGGTIVVDMTTITNTDQEGKWKKMLEDHLVSDDFFSVEKFPTATLELTSVSMGTNNTILAKGDLTIKGITLGQSFEIKIDRIGDNTKYTTKLEFDRTRFNIKYGSNNFFDGLKDKAINDLVTIEAEIIVKN